MKLAFLTSAIVLAIIAFVVSTYYKNEAFDNTGALIQLSASHVPTAEDATAMQEYRRQVEHDLADMTE